VNLTGWAYINDIPEIILRAQSVCVQRKAGADIGQKTIYEWAVEQHTNGINAFPGNDWHEPGFQKAHVER